MMIFRLSRFLLHVFLVIGLTGCSVKPKHFTEKDHSIFVHELSEKLKISKNMEESNEQSPTAPISLHEAMARAALYNFEHKVKRIELDIAKARQNTTKWDFYPQLIGSFAATERSNTLASSSKSVITGQESLELSTSNDRSLQEASLNVTWNLLDTCVNYYSSRQSGNKYYISEEQRRGVLNKLLLDVRTAFYKTASAQNLLKQIEEFNTAAQIGLKKIEKLEQSKLLDPVAALNRKKAIHSRILQLQNLRTLLLKEKIELARLMNMPPSIGYELVPPADLRTPQISDIPDALALVDLALVQRPELLEARYNVLLTADDKKKAFLRLFPSLELSASTNYSSNHYLQHDTWEEVGLKVAWKLLDSVRANDEMDIVSRNIELSESQLENLSLAVIAQVQLAYIDYNETLSSFLTTQELAKINGELQIHQQNRASQFNLAGVDMIQVQGDNLLADLEKDISYAKLQSALGRLLFSVGEDLYGDIDRTATLEQVTTEIADRDNAFLARNNLLPQVPAQ